MEQDSDFDELPTQPSDQGVRQSHKLEIVGALASGVAHDFNNLLMGIIGCADVSLSKLEEGHPARTAVNEIRNAALRGTVNVSQLMAFSKQREPQRDVVDLNEVLSDTYQMLQPLIGEDVEFDLTPSPTPVYTLCDASQIEQILLNLAINARHAMPHGGTFSVSTEAVDDRSDSVAHSAVPGGVRYALLTVSDTGCGMNEETKRRAFEAFFTTRATGTGLGLWTVRRIIEQNGGFVDLESDVGRGTTFRIFLPLVEDYTERPQQPSSMPPQVGHSLVLVIDDEPLVRLAVEHYLTQGGYRVLSAPDGPTALAIVRGHSEPIAAVVTDVVLSGMPGPEILREVKRLRPRVGAVFVSAHSLEELLSQGRVDETVPVLQKPVDAETLVHAVARCIADASIESCGGPARTAGPPIPLTGSTADVEGRRRVVLLVDDDETTREALEELFSAAGYDVLEASNGNQALDIANGHAGTIDILVTDICLRDIDGLELAERIGGARPDMAVLYLSAWPRFDPAVRNAVQKRPRTAFVPKPTVFETLLAEVQRLIDTEA